MRIIPLRALVVLLVVALATSGFAHRIVSPDEQAAQVYAQAFGLTAEDICGDEDGTSVQKDCEACRLHASMVLPEPAVALILAELSLDPADWTPQPPVRHSLTAEAARAARAPPTV